MDMRAWFGIVTAALALSVGPRPARGGNPVESEMITVQATVRETPPRIELDWPGVADSGGFTIHRKPMEAGSWGDVYATLLADATRFEDDKVAVGVGYEYRVRTVGKPESAGGRFPAMGHVYSGIALPPADDRGAVLLLVDATMAAPLTGEIVRLEQDLIGDGWVVLRSEVARQAAVNAPGKPAEVEAVKAVIREACKAAPSAMRAVFLLGRVPIPYSGWLQPDGHGNTPRVADTYYAVPDETWTDTHDYGAGNRAGDGIYDQSEFQSANVKLAVGRVDMSGMPFFGLSETELLRRYLNKLHAYRHRRTVFQPLGGVGSGGLVGCRTGFTLKTLFKRNQARVEGLGSQWDGELLAPSLWRYQEGLSYNLNALGEKLSERVPQYVFTGAWGSGTINYDESAEGGRMAVGRAYTANGGAGLVWICGVPDRHFHWMAMGEPIGTCERLCMANGALYPSGANGNFYHGIFRGLLGDPTLRLQILAPPTALTVVGNALAWEASSEAGTAGFRGYHVYRAATRSGPFVRLTAKPVSETFWTDPAPPAEAVYQVRAIRLETSTTGSYQNNSQGVFASRHAVDIAPEFSWVTLREGCTVPFRVRLSSPPTAATTVSVSNAAGDAGIAVRSGADLAFTPADWNLWQTVVLGAAYGEDTNDVSAMIRLTSPGLADAYVGVTRPARTIRVSSQSLAVPAGGTAFFMVRLSAPPPAGRTATVSVQRASGPRSGGSIGLLSDEAILFTPDNWEVWRTVTLINAPGGADASSNQSADFRVSSPGYRGVTVSVGVQPDADEGDVEVTAYAGFGGASVTPLGVTTVPRGKSVPITAAAAPGFRFFRWVAARGSVTFTDPASARTAAAIAGHARIMAVFERGEGGPVGAISDDNHAPTIESPARSDSPVVPVKGTVVGVTARDPDGDALSFNWSLAVGAGPATFAAPHAAESAVTFCNDGAHILRVTVGDGKGGRTASEVTVIAVSPPAIARQPSDAASVAGRPAKLRALGSGAFLSYQWFKDGKPMLGMTNSVCRTPPVKATDNGAKFVVEVRNRAGAVRSREARLTVVEGPVGTGLDGDYSGVNNADFVFRTDPGLHGNLGRPAGITPPYNVCWTGKLLAPHSETFTFCAHNGKSGGQLWIDGKQICDGRAPLTAGSIELEAGRKYDVKLKLTCDRDDTAYFQWNSETLDLPSGQNGYPSVPVEYLYSEVAGSGPGDDESSDPSETDDDLYPKLP